MPKPTLEERALAHYLTAPTTSTALAPIPRARPTTPKSALRTCRAARKRSFDSYLSSTKGGNIDKHFAAREGDLAYCKAIPILTGKDSVCDFIACIAHGILIGAVPSDRAGALLYAAQIVSSVDSRPSRSACTPTPSPKNPLENQGAPTVRTIESTT